MKIIIQKGLLRDLSSTIEEYNDQNKPRLIIDVAVYFVNLINVLPSYYRFKMKKGHNYANLCSQKMKKIRYDYNKYIHFLIKHNFITLGKNYGVDIKECKSFKISDKYFIDEVVTFEIRYNTLVNKIKKPFNLDNEIQKVINSKVPREHLIENFNSHLKLDFSSCYAEIESSFKGSIETGNICSFAKAMNYLQIINDWYSGHFTFTNSISSDYRLHTLLTRTPRIFRKYLTYKGEHIVGIDLKSSQLYFLTVIIRAIYEKNKSLLTSIGVSRILDDKLIEGMLSLKLNRNNLLDFAFDVLRNDFYDNFVQHIKLKYNHEGKPIRATSVFKKSRIKDQITDELPRPYVEYQSERDLAKAVVMELLNSKPSTKVPEAGVFRKMYPSIWVIKTYLYEKDIKFHYLLSTVEGHCLLDVVAKKIKVDWPNMPLWTIHDSLWTTSSKIDMLHTMAEDYLEKITTIQAQFKED